MACKAYLYDRFVRKVLWYIWSLACCRRQHGDSNFQPLIFLYWYSLLRHYFASIFLPCCFCLSLLGTWPVSRDTFPCTPVASHVYHRLWASSIEILSGRKNSNLPQGRRLLYVTKHRGTDLHFHSFYETHDRGAATFVTTLLHTATTIWFCLPSVAVCSLPYLPEAGKSFDCREIF